MPFQIPPPWALPDGACAQCDVAGDLDVAHGEQAVVVETAALRGGRSDEAGCCCRVVADGAVAHGDGLGVVVEVEHGQAAGDGGGAGWLLLERLSTDVGVGDDHRAVEFDCAAAGGTEMPPPRARLRWRCDVRVAPPVMVTPRIVMVGWCGPQKRGGDDRAATAADDRPRRSGADDGDGSGDGDAAGEDAGLDAGGRRRCGSCSAPFAVGIAHPKRQILGVVYRRGAAG